MIHADRRKDMAKLIGAIHDYAKGPKYLKEQAHVGMHKKYEN